MITAKPELASFVRQWKGQKAVEEDVVAAVLVGAPAVVLGLLVLAEVIVWYLKQQFRQGDNIDQKDGIF
jgi:ABC-type phosphate transport system permease subunit